MSGSENSKNPIFIHSLFRTGSTYIWNKFRQNPKYVCYYEPFHHVLADVTKAGIGSTLTTDFDAVGHPRLDRYYLSEYERLLQENTPGVPYFKKEFSFDWFCLESGSEKPTQKKYIDHLIQAAGDRLCVFQFNRTALRTAWFKSVYPGSLNIYLFRNPRDQWQSYFRIQQKSGFDSFFIMDVMALSKHSGHPLFRPLSYVIPLLQVHDDSYGNEESIYRMVLRSYSNSQKYFLFYYLWLISLIKNVLGADLLMDIDALSHSESYRDRTAALLIRHGIAGLNFDDCRITRYEKYPLSPEIMDEIEGFIQNLVARTSCLDCYPEFLRRLPAEWKEKFRPTDRPNPDLLLRMFPESPIGFSRVKDAEIDALWKELRDKEQQIQNQQEALAEKTSQLMKQEEIAASLRNDAQAVRHSVTFRVGKAVLFPLRPARKPFRRLKTTRPSRQGNHSRKLAPSDRDRPPRKVSLMGQLHFDFGRHRSGLKYGLEQLKTLHHPDGVLLDAFIERTFYWHPAGITPYSQPWIGFIHVPPNIPVWYHPEQSNQAIFLSPAWQRSLPFCLGLFAFSQYHQQHLKRMLPVPVEALLLPSETPRRTWSWDAFESNRQKKVVQVGWWLRKLHGIYQLPSPSDYQKVFLHVGHKNIPALMEKEKQILVAEGKFRPVMYDSVRTVRFLRDGEYDRLLGRNIVFMYLYDVSASNAIVECMVRNTPLLINRLEAVVEYLGEEYPFYFESLEEAAAKLADRDVIHRTHQYLNNLHITSHLTGTYFLEAFSNSEIYRSLEIPRNRPLMS